MKHIDVDVREVEDADEIRGMFPLMVQLRPHLVEEEYMARWKRQHKDGYNMLGLYWKDRLYALAGYRIQENLVHGRFLYLDDLVTDAGARGRGFGEKLLMHLQRRAHELGCSKLVLDTPLSNSLGHRFYFRCGMLATSLRFAIEV